MARGGFSKRRVAIVHYWLVSMRGGERVVERLLHLFPDADIFTNVYDPTKTSETLKRAKITAGFVNRLPFASRLYQYYLPLMPLSLECLDLTSYDLVISSESGPAKGVITHPDAVHLCYCHSPMRYLWDQYHQYRAEAPALARHAMPLMYHRLRTWDVSSSARVDRFVANSQFVRQRIRKVWRRESDVVHPPVDVGLFHRSEEVGPEYLWVGQMVPYKRPDLVVEAFNANGLPLRMVGVGSMLRKLKSMAAPNITFVDHLDFTALRAAYASCRALVMTAEEDFGITPVECMASGRPVVALGRGGALDSVIPGKTGLFFEEPTAEALNEVIDKIPAFLADFDPLGATEQARTFAPEHFDRRILELTQAV